MLLEKWKASGSPGGGEKEKTGGIQVWERKERKACKQKLSWPPGDLFVGAHCVLGASERRKAYLLRQNVNMSFNVWRWIESCILFKEEIGTFYMNSAEECSSNSVFGTLVNHSNWFIGDSRTNNILIKSERCFSACA